MQVLKEREEDGRGKVRKERGRQRQQQGNLNNTLEKRLGITLHNEGKGACWFAKRAREGEKKAEGARWKRRGDPAALWTGDSIMSSIDSQ